MKFPPVAVTPSRLFRFCLVIGLVTLTSLAFGAPPELQVSGNHLVNKSTGALVRLTGVNVPSLAWGAGENITGSITQATSVWQANIIRLAINQTYWNSGGSGFTAAQYQATIAGVVSQVSAANCYVDIDLHTGTSIASAPDSASVTLWTTLAGLYKNNPAVLFGIYNEPDGYTWTVWQNGGTVGTGTTPGMQTIVTAIRNTGANNLIIAGGLSYASDLSGLLSGYALTDSTGDGIMYDAHLYPWDGYVNNSSSGWVTIAQQYPTIIGEFGHDGTTSGGTGTSFGGNSPLIYMSDIMGFIEAMNANSTAWAFHPHGGPALITDFTNCTPASFSGLFVMDRLMNYRNASYASTVANSSFETPTTSTFAYRPAGASWTFTGNAGIQATCGTAIAGTQTAFLQTAAASDAGSNSVDGSMSQTINFASTGAYTVSFQLAQRGTKTVLPINVSIDGVPISSVAYTPTAVVGADKFAPVTTDVHDQCDGQSYPHNRGDLERGQRSGSFDRQCDRGCDQPFRYPGPRFPESRAFGYRCIFLRERG